MSTSARHIIQFVNSLARVNQRPIQTLCLPSRAVNKRVIYSMFSLRRHPETHHFWTASWKYLFVFDIRRERPSSPFMSIWSAVDPAVLVSTQLLALAVWAEWFLILTVRTCPINDMQSGITALLSPKITAHRTITAHMHTRLTSDEKQFNCHFR